MSSKSHVGSVSSLVSQATSGKSASKAKANRKQTVSRSTTQSGNAIPRITSSTAVQTDTSPVPKKRPTSFFDLPLELRIMIYEYNVLDDKIRPYEYANKRMQVPGYKTPKEPPRSADMVSWSRVCRRTRMESEPILYGKNTILVPGGYLALEFFDKCLHNEVRRSWVKSIELFWSGYDVLNYDHAIYLSNHMRDDKRPGGSKSAWEGQQETLMPEERLEMGKLVYEAYERHGLDTEDELRSSYRSWHLPSFIQRLFSRPQRMPDEIVWQPIMAFVQEHLQLERLYFHLEPLTWGRGRDRLLRSMLGHVLLSFSNGFLHGMPKLILADPHPDQLFVNTLTWFSEAVERWTEDRKHNRPTLAGNDPNDKGMIDWIAWERFLDACADLEREEVRGSGVSVGRGWLYPAKGVEGL